MQTKNLQFLFIDPDEHSKKWDEDFFNLLRKHDLQLMEHIATADKLYINEYTISSFINKFTKCDSFDNNDRLYLSSLKNKNNFIKDVQIKDSVLKIETTKGLISVGILSDLIPTFEKEFPDIKTNPKSGNYCHKKSIEISKRLGKKNDLVTGYCYGMSNKSKYLHSWVETSINDTDVVIDYTINALINKQGYYQINHAKPISRIPSDTIISDEFVLNKISQVIPLSSKEYLLFRDEIFSDIEKSHISFEEDNQK